MTDTPPSGKPPPLPASAVTPRTSASSSSRDLDGFHSFVAGRDVFCPACGYSLRDLLEPVCPECGERLVLGVHLAEPRVARLIALLVPLVGSLGFGGIVLVWGLSANADRADLVPLAVLVMLTLPGVIVPLCWRARLRRASQAAFLFAFVCALVLPAACMGWFFVMVG